MKSTLSWLDYNATARDKTLQVLALFKEQESRDELGIAGVRDAIADQLFPGTSTIQTRLRYFFFIPWLYAQLEAKGVPSDRLQADGRRAELALSAQLATTGQLGVIGSSAGSTLQRLPSSIYWAGLEHWHIRRFPGSTQQYFAHANRLYELRKHQQRRHQLEEAEHARSHDTWHPHVLKLMPVQFPQEATLQLTRDEASLLLDLWSNHASHSLLAWLAQDMAKRGQMETCEEIWAHPRAADFPQELKTLIAHAHRFALLVNGAALLYNLMLSQLRPDLAQKMDEYDRQLAQWAQTSVPVLRDWNIQDFWPLVTGKGHTISESTRRFIETFHHMALQTKGAIRQHPPAQMLIRQREQQLKRARSRFNNPTALKQWGGGSGLGLLNYRWHRSRDLLKDWFDGYQRENGT